MMSDDQWQVRCCIRWTAYRSINLFVDHAPLLVEDVSELRPIRPPSTAPYNKLLVLSFSVLEQCNFSLTETVTQFEHSSRRASCPLRPCRQRSGSWTSMPYELFNVQANIQRNSTRYSSWLRPPDRFCSADCVGENYVITRSSHNIVITSTASADETIGVYRIISAATSPLGWFWTDCSIHLLSDLCYSMSCWIIHLRFMCSTIFAKIMWFLEFLSIELVFQKMFLTLYYS